MAETPPESPARQGPGGKPGFQIVTSLGFVDWLAGQQISLALTTYHVGGLILLGRKPAGDQALPVDGPAKALDDLGRDVHGTDLLH